MDSVEEYPNLPTNVGTGRSAPYISALLQSISGLLVRFAVRLNGALPRDGSENVTGVMTFDANAIFDGATLHNLGIVTTAASFFGADLTVSAANLFKTGTYTIATLPAAAAGNAGCFVYVSDEIAGQKFKGSDGAAWLNIA